MIDTQLLDEQTKDSEGRSGTGEFHPTAPSNLLELHFPLAGRRSPSSRSPDQHLHHPSHPPSTYPTEQSTTDN